MSKCVYVLRADNGVIKIGMTSNLEQRIRRLGYKYSLTFDLIYEFKCESNKFLEKHLLETFSEKRIEGEWFNLDEADVKAIPSHVDEWLAIQEEKRRKGVELEEYRAKLFAKERGTLEELRILASEMMKVQRWRRKAIAEAIGVTPGAVSSALNKGGSANTKVLLRIMAFLGHKVEIQFHYVLKDKRLKHQG